MPPQLILLIIGALLIAIVSYGLGGTFGLPWSGKENNKTKVQQTTEAPKVDMPKPKKEPPKPPKETPEPKVSVKKIQKITIERDKDNDRINYIVFDNGNKTKINNVEELKQILNDSLSKLAEKVEVKCDGNDDYRIITEVFLKEHNKYNN